MSFSKSKARLIVLLFILFIFAACTATRLQKEQSKAFLEKGISFIELRQYPQALRELQEAEKYNPRNEEVYYYMGMVYHAMDMKEKAFASFQQAIFLKDDYSEAHNYLGTLYMAEKNWGQALAHFEKAVDNPLYNTPAVPLYNAGWVYYSQKDYTKALDSYRRALQREPSTVLRPQIEKNIGLIYFEQNDFPNAIRHFKQSVEINPNIFDAHFFLGESYLKTGDKANARKAFETVVNLAPKTSFGKQAGIYLRSLK